MGFRTLEISQAAELHIRNGQLEVTSKEGTILIPVEDLNQIMVHGANIRLSTMDLSILSQNKVGVVTLDEKYLPTAIVLPFEGHARQSKLMHAQVGTEPGKYRELWIEIIRAKISNQARALLERPAKNGASFNSKRQQVFPELHEKGSTFCTASRKPGMTLVSLPSVALSSISVKQ